MSKKLSIQHLSHTLRSCARVDNTLFLSTESNTSWKGAGFIFFVTILVGAGMLSVFGYARAASVFDIEYPIGELEGCADRLACKAYCNELSHQNACAAFAQKYGLINQIEAKRAQKLPSTGPGGCKGQEECRRYCEDASHQDECLEFGRKYGLISDADARVGKEIRQQKGPGGCTHEQECDAYCADQTHLEECVSFGEKHGFISGEEAVTIRKFGAGGAGPGGCRGRDACHAYCEEESHQVECIDFAEKRRFMSHEEAALARKFAGRTGPGGCRGEQCRDYCNDPDHAKMCLDFAEKEGLMPKEEAARARKFLEASAEGGPGGCRGRACQEYCSDTSHGEECFAFARKHGLIRPEEEKDFETGQKLQQKVKEAGGPGGCRNDEECRAYCSDPSHVEECVAFAAAHGGISAREARRMLEGFTKERFEATPGTESLEEMQKFQDNVRGRFERFRQEAEKFHTGGGQNDMRSPGFGGPSMMQGPGGCASPKECMEYCQDHADECQNFHVRPENEFDRREQHEGWMQEGHPFEGLGPRPGTNGIFQPMQRPAEGFIHQQPSEGNFPPMPMPQPSLQPSEQQMSPESSTQPPSSQAPRKGFFASAVEFLLR